MMDMICIHHLYTTPGFDTLKNFRKIKQLKNLISPASYLNEGNTDNLIRIDGYIDVSGSRLTYSHFYSPPLIRCGRFISIRAIIG